MIHGRADCRAQPLGNASQTGGHPPVRERDDGCRHTRCVCDARGGWGPVARVTARPRACRVLDSDWWGTADAACLAMERVRLPREAACASGAGAFVRPDLLLPSRRHGFGTGGLWGLPT